MSTKPGQTSSGVIVPRSVTGPKPAWATDAHVLEAGVAADGQGAGADDLHARVLLRVVRRGDADAAVEPELADGVVDHLGADHPEVADVRAAVCGAFHHGGGHRRRRDAHVTTDGDRTGLEVLHVGAADGVTALLVQLRAVEAANVVRLEDPWIEHSRDAIVGESAGRRRDQCRVSVAA